VVLACAAVPIAVAANSFRIFGTGLLVQHGYENEAEGFYHTVSGLLIFAVALVMLFALHRVISLILFALHRVISLIWKSDAVATHSVAHVEERPTWEVHREMGAVRFGIVAVTMLATAIFLRAHSSIEIIPPRQPLSSLPSQIDGWKGADSSLSEEELDILGHPEYLLRDYEIASLERPEQPWFNLYAVYFPSQRAGDTIHSPDHCLPGAGWIPTSREVIGLARPDGSSIPVNRYVVAKLLERRLVLYWFQAHGRVVSSEWWSKYYLISDSIHMNRSDGGMVRLMTPMLEGESADAAQARMMKLGSHFLALLDDHIPR
jgi:EpsI family protein